MEATNEWGMTPFLSAIIFYRLNIARCLALEFKANVFAKNKHGLNAIHLAVAAKHSDTDVLHWLLTETSLDINDRGGRGKAPIHRCAATKSFAQFKMLAETGKADLTLKDNKVCMHYLCRER